MVFYLINVSFDFSLINYHVHRKCIYIRIEKTCIQTCSKKVQVEISSLISDISYPLLVSAECLPTWYCSGLLTLYLFLQNLEMVGKLPYECKNHMLISSFFQPEIDFYYENICALTVITT